MISYNKFNRLIYELFCKPIFVQTLESIPAWSSDINDVKVTNCDKDTPINGACLFWHEEPISKTNFNNLINMKIDNNGHVAPGCYTSLNLLDSSFGPFLTDAWILLFSNSEHSQDKKEILKNTNFQDWYFFFHGFLSLYWFSDYKFLETPLNIDKVFICLNHLLSKKRGYRLYLLALISSKNLDQFGNISAPLLNQKTVYQELISVDNFLSKKAKKIIYTQLYANCKEKILDEVQNYNNASADIVAPKYLNTSFWHIVTETVFNENKLHLTEKIFKPIVTKRPFILASSTGALNYLKSYGFKTFDQWIDESYDNISDPDERLEKISDELEKLCNLTQNELMTMYKEMTEILEYNHNHFFGKFKEIIVDEMISNFKKCIFNYNKDRSERFRLPEENLDYQKIRSKLLL
jgi:hypothetical protein